MSFDPTTKVVGAMSHPSFGGVDLQLDEFTWDAEQTTEAVVPLGQGGWKYEIPTDKQYSGSFSGTFDPTIYTTVTVGAGSLPAPMGNYVAISCPIGSKTMSCMAIVSKLSITQPSGVVKIKGDWKSSGPVTYA